MLSVKTKKPTKPMLEILAITDDAGLSSLRPSLNALRQLISWKPATFWKASDSRPRQGRRVNPSSGEHDRVAAADGAAIDHRGVHADVHCVVLSSRAKDA